MVHPPAAAGLGQRALTGARRADRSHGVDLAHCSVLSRARIAAMTSHQQPSKNHFNRRSTAEEVTTGLDLTGKTALVTGCNSGIGFETMRVLAMRGAEVIGTARSLDTARDAFAKEKKNKRPPPARPPP